MRWALLLLAAGCSRTPAGPESTKPVQRAPAGPMSESAEYAIDHVSRDAGEDIFVRTGIGDPYRTGVPSPIFLALLRGSPDLIGPAPQALRPPPRRRPAGAPAPLRLRRPRARSRQRRPRRAGGPADRHAPHRGPV